eukprot:1302964-Pleurochrysis_carterae.AAC.1
MKSRTAEGTMWRVRLKKERMPISGKFTFESSTFEIATSSPSLCLVASAPCPDETSAGPARTINLKKIRPGMTGPLPALHAHVSRILDWRCLASALRRLSTRVHAATTAPYASHLCCRRCSGPIHNRQEKDSSWSAYSDLPCGAQI